MASVKSFISVPFTFLSSCLWLLASFAQIIFSFKSCHRGLFILPFCKITEILFKSVCRHFVCTDSALSALSGRGFASLPCVSRPRRTLTDLVVSQTKLRQKVALRVTRSSITSTSRTDTPVAGHQVSLNLLLRSKRPFMAAGVPKPGTGRFLGTCFPRKIFQCDFQEYSVMFT